MELRQKIYNKIFHHYLVYPEKVTDSEAVRKILLIFGIAGIGVLSLFLMGAIALIRQEIFLGVLDYSVALGLALLLFYLRNSSNVGVCCYVGVVLMSLFFWYLLMSGAGGGNAFLWLYTYPLLVFFLLGTRHGAMAITAFFLPCVIFLGGDLASDIVPSYDLDFTLRFIPSFIVVSLFAFIFEKSNERARRYLIEAQVALEQQVEERTRDLQHEITVRKENEEQLRNSEQRYRSLFDSIGDAVCIISRDGRFLEVNQELCQGVGYSYNELLCLSPAAIHNPGSAVQVTRSLQDLFDRQLDALLLEVEYRHRQGEVLPVELRAKRILFGDAEAVLVVSRDIRERKKVEVEKKILEKQLLRSQKMEAIGLMAGGVAHDLNNILSGVVAYPDLLLRKLTPDDPMYVPLDCVKQSGKRAAAVVADLLTVARGVAHQKEVASLNVLVDQYLSSSEHQTLAREHLEISYMKELGPDVMNIECSVVHVNKCLMNLVFNASEAIHGLGRVIVSTCNKEVDSEQGRKLNLAAGSYVALTVRDTGIGIAEQDRQQIFEPFYTKKKMGRSGTGLGLSVVWNSMQDHGGIVTVESSVEGSLFTLYFPATQAENTSIDVADQVDCHRGGGETVLVVDDDAVQRDVAVQMLTSLGYSAHALSSGEEAVALLEKETADLLLLDMLMEPGINGYQTYARIVQRHPGQKAVIASGYSENEDVIKARQLGASGFLKKPYTTKQLGECLHRVLHCSP